MCVSTKVKRAYPCGVASISTVIMTVVVEMQNYTDDKTVPSLINTHVIHTGTHIYTYTNDQKLN